MRIQELGGGGGGVKTRRPENSLDNFILFIFLLFLVLSVFYNLQKGSNGFITGKSILFQGSRGGSTLSGGGGGVQLFRGLGVGGCPTFFKLESIC